MAAPEHAQTEPSAAADAVLDQFRALPLPDRLRHLPGLLDSVLQSERRGKVVFYLETLLARIAPERSPFFVSRSQIEALHAFSPDELARLTDDDIATISERMETHFRQDWYLEEVVIHAQTILDEQEATPIA